MVRAVTASGWTPELPAGNVWFCGCRRAYGSQGGRWVPLTPDVEITTLSAEDDRLPEQRIPARVHGGPQRGDEPGRGPVPR